MARVALDWRTLGVGGHGPYLRVWGSDEAPRGEAWELRAARSVLQDHAVYEGGWAAGFTPRPGPVAGQWVGCISVAGVMIDAEAMALRLGVQLEVLGEPPPEIQPAPP